jgi:hypothetical protein
MRRGLQGMLSGEELSSAYASADIFMMPSESETLGFVALEAMASGLVVVSVAAGGLVDIITKPGIIGESFSINTGHSHSQQAMIVHVGSTSFVIDRSLMFMDVMLGGGTRLHVAVVVGKE